MNANRRLIGARLPARALARQPRLERDAQQLRPEAARAFRVVGRELDQS
jgi:hypothetical protein